MVAQGFVALVDVAEPPGSSTKFEVCPRSVCRAFRMARRPAAVAASHHDIMWCQVVVRVICIKRLDAAYSVIPQLNCDAIPSEEAVLMFNRLTSLDVQVLTTRVCRSSETSGSLPMHPFPDHCVHVMKIETLSANADWNAVF